MVTTFLPLIIISLLGRAVNSGASDGIWSKFKLIQAFINGQVTCKNQEDPFQNEDATAVTTFLPL